MDVTLSLDDDLVQEVNRIALEWDTTLASLVQHYFEGLTTRDLNSQGGAQPRQALDRTFERFKLRIGTPTWTRAELHGRF